MTDFSVGGDFSVGVTEPNIVYVNEAGVSEDVMREIRGNQDIASEIEKWSQSLRQQYSTRDVDVFARQKWSGASHAFAKISSCAWAVENDDILSTLADVTEGLTFQRSSGRSVRFDLVDEQQEQMWTQWGEEVNLDARVREMFRELFKVSQVYVGLFWEPRIYAVEPPPTPGVVDQVRSEKPKAMRRKSFPVVVPARMTILDPTKIFPIGSLLFGQEQFAYIADDDEHSAFERASKGQILDGAVQQMIIGPYTPTKKEAEDCSKIGINPGRLWKMRDISIFRHTLTRASYERFAAVRLASSLETLNLKAALRASDRAALQGNANFIVVVTKGTDQHPARQAEVDNLKKAARTIARLPVLVGDHRLKVEIVSPALDNTLIESRWQVLDSRLVFQALQSFQPIVQGGNSSGSGVSEMSRVVSAGLENRRAGIARAIERKVLSKVVEANSVLTEQPHIVFAPKHISLDFQADVINAVLKVRDRGDISRETMLEELDFSQEVEARRRARERLVFDEIFQSGTPYSSPQQNPYGQDAPKPSEVTPNAAGPSIEGGRPPGAKTEGD